MAAVQTRLNMSEDPADSFQPRMKAAWNKPRNPHAHAGTPGGQTQDQEHRQDDEAQANQHGARRIEGPEADGSEDEYAEQVGQPLCEKGPQAAPVTHSAGTQEQAAHGFAGLPGDDRQTESGQVDHQALPTRDAAPQQPQEVLPAHEPQQVIDQRQHQGDRHAAGAHQSKGMRDLMPAPRYRHAEIGQAAQHGGPDQPVLIAAGQESGQF